LKKSHIVSFNMDGYYSTPGTQLSSTILPVRAYMSLVLFEQFKRRNSSVCHCAQQSSGHGLLYINSACYSLNFDNDILRGRTDGRADIRQMTYELMLLRRQRRQMSSRGLTIIRSCVNWLTLSSRRCRTQQNLLPQFLRDAVDFKLVRLPQFVYSRLSSDLTLLAGPYFNPTRPSSVKMWGLA